jgi:hypothetical protein
MPLPACVDPLPSNIQITNYRLRDSITLTHLLILIARERRVGVFPFLGRHLLLLLEVLGLRMVANNHVICEIVR